MKLSSVLDSRLIFLKVPGSDRTTIYRSLLTNASKHIRLPDTIDGCMQHMIEREETTKIPYEMGAALPHWRSHTLKDLNIIIGVLAEPVKLKENDLSPTKLVIMSLISDNTAETYLKALSAFSRYVLKGNAVEKFCGCSSPEAILKVLEQDNVMLRTQLTVEDIMTDSFPFLKKGTSVGDFLDLCTSANRTELPVVDENSNFLGVVNATSVIQRSIPNHILIMDNLNFLTSFEPFEKILSEDSERAIDEFIEDPKVVIDTEKPLIQCTVMLAKRETRHIYVTHKDSGQLVGMLSISDIVAKVLRA